MQKAPYDIVIFLVVVSGLILFLIGFVIFILFIYRKKQQTFEKNIAQIKQDHEKTLLSTQLEIQEQTLQHISREIHDNISLSLTLAKLQLNTFNWDDRPGAEQKLDQSVTLLTKSIAELSDLSKGMNTELINQQGFLRAVEDELDRIRQTCSFTIDYQLTGETIFTNSQQDLILFRIIQEAFNNIIKHAAAKHTFLHIHYNDVHISITIRDDGVGFDTELATKTKQSGLKNMESRTKMLGGQMSIESQPGLGTTLTFTIPYEKP